MTKSECLMKSKVRMTNTRSFTLLLLCLIGCGHRIPGEFTVSGQPLNHWLEALEDGQPEVSVRPVRALSNVGPDVPEVVDSLAESLSDPDREVRSQAALALLKFGPKAKAAIPALTEAQGDPDKTVRDLVGKALDNVQGQ